MDPAASQEFHLVGLSHKTAAVEVRERLATGLRDSDAVVPALAALEGVREVLLVSTCNRVEVYAWGSDAASASILESLVNLGGAQARPSLYALHGRAALEHLFRVCSSLDSMVLGEPQILGQVKEAFAAAQRARSLGANLTRASEAAFAAAKRVRHETGVGAASVSMASAAVDLARKVFGSLDGHTVLVVGAGEMSELAARQLAAGQSRIIVANRTFERAAELAASVGGTARRFEELPALLAEADIVVTSTAAPRPIITVAAVQAAMKARHHRPLFLVDVAVPRDVEPGVGRLDDVYSYDVDDLEQVVQEGRQSRQAEALRAEALIAEELDRFLEERRVRDSLPVMVQLRQRADEIVRAEAARTLSNFGEELTPRQRRSIDAMGRAIVNKLLHHPTLKLREAGREGEGRAEALSAQLAELFDLEPAAAPSRPAALRVVGSGVEVPIGGVAAVGQGGADGVAKDSADEETA